MSRKDVAHRPKVLSALDTPEPLGLSSEQAVVLLGLCVWLKNEINQIAGYRRLDAAKGKRGDLSRFLCGDFFCSNY